MTDAIKHLDEFDTGTRYRATLLSSERITPADATEVRELVLEVDGSDFEFQIGQSVGVLAPGDPQFGKEHHFRLYSVADVPMRGESGKARVTFCVRRCRYVDEYSGEEYDGVASNYLCDLRPGDSVTLSGPVGLPFEVPEDRGCHLILIGSGTGIAPFRAFVKHIYQDIEDWHGRIWLFHGASSGLEMIYMNDERNDFSLYYDEDTFQAFEALSPRPSWAEPIAWDAALRERGQELWLMMGESRTYVYVAGLEEMLGQLDTVFAEIAGSEQVWQRRKAELMAGGRWVELVY